MIVNVTDNPISLPSVAYPVIIRLILPEGLSGSSQQLVRLSRDPRLQPAHDGGNGHPGQDQQMHVIGHHHPGILLSKIEWTDATWNPVRGCTKIGPGCKHCYAERFAERFRGVKGHPFEQGFDVRLVPKKLGEPLRWSEPKMIFVNSMSDLLHEGVPLTYIQKVAATMRLAKWHTYQVLTKRSERLRELLSGPLRTTANDAHIWWGVSVEDRKYGLPRIADLQATPAAVRFLEPLLEDIGRLALDGV